MHRLFVAIRPPEPFATCSSMRWAIRRISAGRATNSCISRCASSARWTGRRPVDVADVLGRIHAEKFSIRIESVGRFEQRNSGALWAGVEPKAPLAALAGKVERACLGAGLEPERRAFHPHITLARWKGRRRHEVQRFLERAARSRPSRSRSMPSPCSKAGCRATARITRRSPLFSCTRLQRKGCAIDGVSRAPSPIWQLTRYGLTVCPAQARAGSNYQICARFSGGMYIELSGVIPNASYQA